MQARANLADVRNFGFGVLARHLGGGVRQVNLRGVGRVFIRSGQSDMLCMRQVFAWREYDLSGMPAVQARIDAAYERILDQGAVPVIIDAGANIGAASIWYAQRYPKAKVIAVEPDEGNYAVLVENTRAWTNVLTVKAALGGEPGHVAVKSGKLGWASRTVRADGGVPVLTVEDFARLMPDGQLFIVKVDIEGFEKDVFAGDTGWLAHTAMVAVEPHDWLLPGEFSSQSFLRAVAAHDFELFIAGENLIFVR